MDKAIRTEVGPAREIMGPNMCGVGESVEYFKLSPSQEQIRLYTQVPWSEDTLEEAKETHFLVAVFPISIVKMSDLHGRLLNTDTWPRAWILGCPFAERPGETGWHLVRKTPLEGSLGLPFADQKRLLGVREFIPSAQVMIYTVIAHFKTTRNPSILGDKEVLVHPDVSKNDFKQLFRDTIVNCADCEDGYRIQVGYFDKVDPGGPYYGLQVYRAGGHFAQSDLGLAVAYKPERDWV